MVTLAITRGSAAESDEEDDEDEDEDEDEVEDEDDLEGLEDLEDDEEDEDEESDSEPESESDPESESGKGTVAGSTALPFEPTDSSSSSELELVSKAFAISTSPDLLTRSILLFTIDDDSRSPLSE